MAFDIGVELGGGERAVDHVALELGHVDAVGGKAAHGLVERCRHVAHPKNEGRLDRTNSGRRSDFLTRHDEKARGVVGRVLDVGGKQSQAVDFAGQARGDGADALVAAFGDLAGRAGGIDRTDGPQPVFGDEAAALPQRDVEALHRA